MPRDGEYDEQIKSDVADVKNVGGRKAGAVTAAKFLARFVGETPWVHLDIAGTTQGVDVGCLDKGDDVVGAGYGVGHLHTGGLADGLQSILSLVGCGLDEDIGSRRCHPITPPGFPVVDAPSPSAARSVPA